MSIGEANCLVCGKPLVYWEEARSVTCQVCGREETGHCVCEDGHYVCNDCHRREGVEHIMELSGSTASKDPVRIMIEAMTHQSIYPNGPEHHSLVGAALLAAYANAGGELDLPRALEEMRSRSMAVPGGTCGFWGCCGAAVSCGQAMSIINGSTPMTKDPWAECQGLTSAILGRLSELGGPRCCKRCGFAALEVAVPYVAQATGVQMELPQRISCGFFTRNAECRKEECPYYPLA